MKKLIAAVTFFLSLLAIHAQTLDDIVFYTEDFPPYNYLKEGVLRGSSVNVIERVFQISGSHQVLTNIQVWPWSRGYKTVLEEPKTALFTVTKIPSRENDFIWVGPLTQAQNVLMARKDRKIIINKKEDLLKYSIGAIRFDAGAALVKSFGYPDDRLILVTASANALKMLAVGHLDLFAYDANVTNWQLKENGFDPKDFEPVFVLASGNHYIALNRKTPISIVNLLQTTIDGLRKSGELDRLMNAGLRGN